MFTYLLHMDRYVTWTRLMHRPADTSFSAHNCNLEDNHFMMDLLLAFGPNCLLHPFSDDSTPWCVDVFDMLRSVFQQRENVGR